MRWISLKAIILLLFLSGCSGTHRASSLGMNRMNTSINDLLSSTCQSYEIPGIAVAIFDDSSIIAKAAYGLRRKDAEPRITVDDKFHVGSCAKSMTSTAIAMLVREGKISWNTTPLEVFPDLENTIHPSYRNVTLVQFMNHTAGVQPFTRGDEFKGLPEFTGNSSERRIKFAKWLLQRAPYVQPGTKTLYSNAGFTIAAAMACQVSEKAWEELITQRLFKKLNIVPCFGWPAAHTDDQPWGHWLVDGHLSPHSPSDTYQVVDLIAPAGDLSLSISDFAKFAQLHLAGLSGKTSLLTKKEFERVHSDDNGRGLTLGWYRTGDGEIGAHGSAGTFYAIASIYPDKNLGMAIACNAGGDKAAKGCTQLGKDLLVVLEKERKPNNGMRADRDSVRLHPRR